MLTLSQVMCNDTMMQIKKGNVVGFSSLKPHGKTPTAGVAAGTLDIWKTSSSRAISTRTQPTVAKQLAISSSAAGDITQSVTVTGLDANYEPISVTAPLDSSSGRTKVIISTTVYFLRVLSVTLDAICTGDVFVYDSGDTITTGVPDTATKVYGVVIAGDLCDYNAQTTIPAGKQGWLYAVTWNSYNASTATGVIVQAVITYEDTSTETIVCARYADPGSGSLQFTANPILIPEKADFKLQLIFAATGTGLKLEAWGEIILEDIEPTPVTVDVWTKSQYEAYLTANSRTLSSANLYIIGLDEVPTTFPTEVDLNDTLAIITGATTYLPAKTTDVYFDLSIFPGSTTARDAFLISTTKKAAICIWKCTDSAGYVKYNYGLSAKEFTLGLKTLKISFSAA